MFVSRVLALSGFIIAGRRWNEHIATLLLFALFDYCKRKFYPYGAEAHQRSAARAKRKPHKPQPAFGYRIGLVEAELPP